MSHLKFPALTRLILLVVCQWALAAWPAGALAQRSEATARQAVPAKGGAVLAAAASDAPRFLGMRRCALCHNQSAMPDPEVSREFCLMNESGVFRSGGESARDHGGDKHARAYELMVIPGGLGEQMGKKLGIDVKQAKACLTCHAGASTTIDGLPPSYESGVTCESCHGASSRWDQPHSEPTWRKRLASEKESLGMIDVRDPVRRAKVCYSCHIGNADEGKVVTHEMYAAGHPPLPGIEIETFVAAMPAHWRRISEKGHFQYRDEYLKANGKQSPSSATGHLPRTQAVLVGGVVALRESLRLLAAQPESQRRPELAAFDCQSCHHELRSPAWRQRRPQPGRPGRPRPPEWPLVLARIGLQQLTVEGTAPKLEQHSLNGGIQRLNEVLDRQPFGSPEDLAALIEGTRSTGGFSAWLDAKAQELASFPIDETAARKALQQLYASGSSGYHDFHSARQIAWAIRTIESELRAFPYPTFSADGDATLAQRVARENEDARILSQWKAERLGAANEEVSRLFAPLTTSLKLDLPSGTKLSVVEFMPPSLSAISDYDPENFRTLVKKTAQESGKSGESTRQLNAPRRGSP